MPGRGSIGVQLPADIVLTPSDGSGAVLLMLSDTADNSGKSTGKKAWQMAEILAPEGVRVTNQGPSLQDSPPEISATVFRTDNQLGMGPTVIDNGTLNYLGLNNGAQTYMSGSVQTSVQGKTIQPPYVEEITISGGTEGLSAIEVYAGSIYAADAATVFRSDDGRQFYSTLATSAYVSQLIAFGDSNGTPGLICTVTSDGTTPGAYYYSRTGAPTSWSQVTTGGNRAINFMVSHQGELWGLINPNTIVTCATPFDPAATWASSTTVGDTLHNFQGAVGVANFLLIFKEDGVYALSSTGVVTKVITQFEALPGSDNFEGFSPGFNSNIYMTVDQEVWEYDPASGNLRPLNISNLPDSQLDGSVTVHQGLAYDEQGLYSIHQTNISSTQGTSILRTNFFPNDTFAHERWMVESQSGYRPRGPMKFTKNFSSLATGRHLFFGLNDPDGVNTSLKLGRMTIPRASDPTQDSASEYSVVDSLYRSGWMHHNYPAQYKDYTEVLLDLRALTPVPPNATVSVYYYLDGDLSTRHTLATSLTVDKLHHLEFASGVTARQMLLELILHSDDVKSTPQILAWNVKASVKFDFREVFTLAIRVGDKISTRGRARSPMTAKDIRQRIRQLRAAKNITIRYQDYRGYDFANIRILTGITEIDVVDDASRTDETSMTLRILRVSDQFLNPFIVDELLGVADIAHPSTIGGAEVIGP